MTGFELIICYDLVAGECSTNVTREEQEVEYLWFLVHQQSHIKGV